MEKGNQKIENGIFIRGLVVSSSARIIERRDGSGRSVVVTHEIGTQPGLAKWVLFIDVNDPRVSVNGDKVEKFPKLEELMPIHLKVNALRADKGQVEVKSAEILS